MSFAGVELALGKLDATAAVAIVTAAGGFSLGVSSQSGSVGAPSATPTA
jgi:hypothetical protein